MKIFAGEWVRNILNKIGMSEDEAIESQMVSRCIRQAQQKTEGKVYGSFDAASAAEWQKTAPNWGGNSA